MSVIYRVHAVTRMFERGIAEAEAQKALSEGEEIVITVYEPDPAQWADGFRRRKQ